MIRATETDTMDLRQPQDSRRQPAANPIPQTPHSELMGRKVSVAQAKPYIVMHLEASEVAQPVQGSAIVKFINKFMGDTHAILFTGHRRTPYIEEISSAVVHNEFHDIVGQLSTDTLRHVINGADAVATANTEIFWLADRLATPVLLFNAASATPLKPWSQYGYQLGLREEQTTPYQICEALAYLLSFSAHRSTRGDFLV